MIVRNNSKIPSSKRFTICNAHWTSKDITKKEIEEWLKQCVDNCYGTFCIFPEGYELPESPYEHVYEGCCVIDKTKSDYTFDVLTANGDLKNAALDATAMYILGILTNEV